MPHQFELGLNGKLPVRVDMIGMAGPSRSYTSGRFPGISIWPTHLPASQYIDHLLFFCFSGYLDSAQYLIPTVFYSLLLFFVSEVSSAPFFLFYLKFDFIMINHMPLNLKALKCLNLHSTQSHVLLFWELFLFTIEKQRSSLYQNWKRPLLTLMCYKLKIPLLPPVSLYWHCGEKRLKLFTTISQRQQHWLEETHPL